MVSTPPHLLWLLVKDYNSFIVKSKKHTFTKEPNNLTNLNTFKFSGLAQEKVIGIEPSDNKKGGIVVVTQKKKALNKPAKRFATVKTRGGTRYAAKTVLGVTKKSGYRSDLEKYALARASAIVESQKSGGVGGKKTKKEGKRGNKKNLK